MTDDEKYYRDAWMSEEQWQCARFIADLLGGFHHIVSPIKQCGNGIEINHRYGGWSTYDNNRLTRAVLMAHDRCIRLDIGPSGPGMIKITLHKRKGREGELWERHPTIEQAISLFTGIPAEAPPIWRPLSEWHEDYHDCLFLFFKKGQYQYAEFTSPLTIYPDGTTEGTSFHEEHGHCDQIFFKRIDTSDFKLLPKPAEAA